MRLLEPGAVVDGFVIGERLHAGGMAHIYSVTRQRTLSPPGFPMVMKVPRMTPGDGAENIVGFEVELQMLQRLEGPHVPRFVAAGDLTVLPYLVMEHVPGQTLQQWMDASDGPLDVDTVVRLAAATALAAHSLHQQNACHLDLKPANVMVRPDGTAVLLDFGLSRHAHQPDLLAEELRLAVGSPAWIAPEQVVGVRGDLRSDVFAIGVILYEMVTGRLPFGTPQTRGGLRQRLWMDPPPPRSIRPELPEWLQEVILRCLEPEAARRHPSAAHLAFDLHHPEQVVITERGRKTQAMGWFAQSKRWFRAAGMDHRPSPLPQEQIAQVPIVMVAVPHWDVSDVTLHALRQAVQRSLGVRPGARLSCVTVVSSNGTSATDEAQSETSVQRRHLAALRRWAQPLELDGRQASCHVLASDDVAEALLRYARGNGVTLIVMGAATHGLQLQRFVATVPIQVAMHAPCSVMLVKPALPFEQLGRDAS